MGMLFYILLANPFQWEAIDNTVIIVVLVRV